MRASVLFVSLWMFCAVAVTAAPFDVGLDATADYYGLIDPTTFFTSARPGASMRMASVRRNATSYSSASSKSPGSLRKPLNVTSSSKGEVL